MRYVIGFIFLFWGSNVSWAEVPQELHYQGYLTNAVGEGVDCPDPIQCTDSINLTFRLYDSPNVEQALWTEIHVGVPFYDGTFHASLGASTSLTPETIENARWLGVSINDSPEMSPRQKLASSAFALHAKRAEQSLEAANATQLGGLPASEYILSDDLKDGDDDTLGDLACAPGMVPKATASGWICDIDQLGATDTTLSDEEVLAIVAGGGYVTGPHTIDTNTQLSEAEVDAFVANNDYASQTALDTLSVGLAPIANSGSFNDLVEVPAGLADGDDDTMNGLSCAENEVPKWDGSSWTCAPYNSGIQATSTPVDCDATTVGSVYFDTTENQLRFCDGVSYKIIRFCDGACPDPTSVACGVSVEDDCGTSCGAIGSALNVLECTPSLVACGEVVTDSCGNECAGSGAALNLSQCNANTTNCGSPVTDNCGNLCAETGTFCSGVGVCTAGACVYQSCADIVTQGAYTGDGLYTVDMDGPGALPPKLVYCDGEGWTLVLHSSMALPYPPHPDLQSTFSILEANGAGDINSFTGTTGDSFYLMGLAHMKALAATSDKLRFQSQNHVQHTILNDVEMSGTYRFQGSNLETLRSELCGGVSNCFIDGGFSAFNVDNANAASCHTSYDNVAWWYDNCYSYNPFQTDDAGHFSGFSAKDSNSQYWTWWMR